MHFLQFYYVRHINEDRDVTGATGHTAEGFASFFNRKVDDIRADTAATPPPVITDTAPSSLSSFRPVTVSEVPSTTVV